MPHIRITSDGFWVDGAPVEAHADDFDVDFSTTPPIVRCTIPANTLDIDLPDAVMRVLRDQRGQPSLRDEVHLIGDRLDGINALLDEQAGRFAEALNAVSRRGHRDGEGA